MLLAPHFVVGAVVVSVVPDPILGGSLAVISHLLLDQLPHWHYVAERNALQEPLKASRRAEALVIFSRVGLDVLLGMLLVLLARPTNVMVALVGGVIACIPDFLLFLAWQLPGNRTLALLKRIHLGVHIQRPGNEPAWPLGVPLQACTMVGAAFILAYL